MVGFDSAPFAAADSVTVAVLYAFATAVLTVTFAKGVTLAASVVAWLPNVLPMMTGNGTNGVWVSSNTVPCPPGPLRSAVPNRLPLPSAMSPVTGP